MNKIILASLFLYSGFVYAVPSEVWECKDTIDTSSWDNIIVKAKRYNNYNKGIIEVFGIKQISKFVVNRNNGHWNFGLSQLDLKFKNTTNEGKLSDNLVFIIQPNGDAGYYDYSNYDPAKPTLLLKCRQTS